MNSFCDISNSAPRCHFRGLRRAVLTHTGAVAIIFSPLGANDAIRPPNSTGWRIVAFASSGKDDLGQRGDLIVMCDDGTQMRELPYGSELDLAWSNAPRKPLPDDQPSI